MMTLDKILETIFAWAIPIGMAIFLILSMIGFGFSIRIRGKEKIERMAEYCIYIICCIAFFIWWSDMSKIPTPEGYSYANAFVAGLFAWGSILVARFSKKWMNIPYWCILIFYFLIGWMGLFSK